MDALDDPAGDTARLIALRPAVASDRDALESLQWRASLANPGDRAALEAHPDAIQLSVEQIDAGGVVVAEVDGALGGFAAIVPRDDGDMDLDALFVEPSAWRRGIGRALVEHCCVLARERGATLLHVVGNPHAEAFYRAADFEHVGTTSTRFGPALLFRRQLL